jgi:hypothetical protein
MIKILIEAVKSMCVRGEYYDGYDEKCASTTKGKK